MFFQEDADAKSTVISLTEPMDMHNNHKKIPSVNEVGDFF